MRASAFLVALLVVGIAVVPGMVAGADTITLSGHVERINGSPFQGVTISIRNTETDVSHAPVITNAGGNFEVSLPAGTYEISASYEGYMATTSYSNISTSASTLSFVLYEVLGTVTGQVTDGVSTLSNVTVSLFNSISNFSAQSTSPYGAFRVENITPGVYIIKAFKIGYNTTVYPDPITIVKGSDVVIDLTLEAASNFYGGLSGRVVYNGSPLPGVKVMLSSEGMANQVTSTDDNGNYTFNQVPPGNYELLLSKNGYVGASYDVIISPLTQISQDASLKRDSLPGTSGFVRDFDLSHSLMVIGLVLALTVSLVSLLIMRRIRGRPELLEKEEPEPGEKSQA